MEEKTTIKSFQDFRAYQNLYKAMLIVHKEIVIKLPSDEKFDLVSQMKRASKAGPALLAEGFSKRYQEKNWGKYLNDTLGEANEMIHHLSVCIDIYASCVDINQCKEVIDIYDLACRQTTKLKQAWVNFHKKND